MVSLKAVAEKAVASGAKVALVIIDGMSPITSIVVSYCHPVAPSTASGPHRLKPANIIGSLLEQSLLLVGDGLVRLLMAELGTDSTR